LAAPCRPVSQRTRTAAHPTWTPLGANRLIWIGDEFRVVAE
jgi:hypothetical protein